MWFVCREAIYSFLWLCGFGGYAGEFFQHPMRLVAELGSDARRQRPHTRLLLLHNDGICLISALSGWCVPLRAFFGQAVACCHLLTHSSLHFCPAQYDSICNFMCT